MPFWLVIGLALVSVALTALLLAKPKLPKPDSLRDFEDPTADAGRPVPVVFGTMNVKGLNLLWYGDKSERSGKQKAN